MALPVECGEGNVCSKCVKHFGVWRWVLNGTNSGSYRGQHPTDRDITVPGYGFIEIRDGGPSGRRL
jgi:hypothetical protein